MAATDQGGSSHKKKEKQKKDFRAFLLALYIVTPEPWHHATVLFYG